MLIVLPVFAVACAAFCILGTVRIMNGDDDWVRAARVYGGGAIAIIGALGVTAALAICLHFFIHS